MHCAESTCPYPGILSLIEKLKAGGVGCAVVSNKPDKAVKILSEKYFPSLFNAAIGENEALGVRRKPAPDTTLLAADALDADINETVYIGDSEVDIETAWNAGCDCICVTWGFRNKEYLKNCGARHFASSADELFDLICCR
jgi:phosphoglycolate phosphatase